MSFLVTDVCTAFPSLHSSCLRLCRTLYLACLQPPVPFPWTQTAKPRPPRERAEVWASFQTLKINEKRLVFLLQQWVCILKSKVLNYLMKAMPVLRRLRQCNPTGEVVMADTPRPRAAEGQALERVRGPARRRQSACPGQSRSPHVGQESACLA